MRYICLEKNQEIDLLAKENATPTQAIHSAIEFCKENNLASCTLEYKGFTIFVDKESDLKELVNEYSEWAEYKKGSFFT